MHSGLQTLEHGGVVQLEERKLCKLDAAGSSPVASIKSRNNLMNPLHEVEFWLQMSMAASSLRYSTESLICLGQAIAALHRIPYIQELHQQGLRELGYEL